MLHGGSCRSVIPHGGPPPRWGHYTYFSRTRNRYSVPAQSYGRGPVRRGASLHVARFHLSGVHYQNTSNWNEYVEKLNDGKLPINRVFPTTVRDRLIRELILQTKSGRIDPSYFYSKFNVDVLSEFNSIYRKLQSDGLLDFDDTEIKLTRKGLLRVDGLLPLFYEDQYKNTRYT